MDDRTAKATLIWAIEFTKTSDRPATAAERGRLDAALAHFTSSRANPLIIQKLESIRDLIG